MIMEENFTAFHWNTFITWYSKNVSVVNMSDNYNITTDCTVNSDIGRLIRLGTLPINIIFGIVGNLLILFVMLTGSSKKTSLCFYMSVLAFADTGKDTLL